jgi:hypothetical protein
MPRPNAIKAASELETLLRITLKHDYVYVKPYGYNLLIQLMVNDTPETIARLTEIRPNFYCAAFRKNNNRWEPLPIEGTLAEAGQLITELLGPYLDPEQY